MSEQNKKLISSLFGQNFLNLLKPFRQKIQALEEENKKLLTENEILINKNKILEKKLSFYIKLVLDIMNVSRPHSPRASLSSRASL